MAEEELSNAEVQRRVRVHMQRIAYGKARILKHLLGPENNVVRWPPTDVSRAWVQRLVESLRQ